LIRKRLQNLYSGEKDGIMKMADIFGKRKRSEIMSRIRSRSGLDRKVHNWLCAKHVRHKMYPKAEGNPDFLLKDAGVYLFVDSCFWHGCPLHFRAPKSSFAGIRWEEKIRKNKERDGRRSQLPYRWIAVWEHSIKNGDLERILKENGIL